MQITLNYQTNQILVDGEPLGIPLDQSRASVVFDAHAGSGVLRLFVEADEVHVVQKDIPPAEPVEPDLMEKLSEADKFEVQMEQIRRGGPNVR